MAEDGPVSRNHLADDSTPDDPPPSGPLLDVPPPEAARHYPLDLPDLPFGRYEHRRLTARDAMVYRIMAEYMNPTLVKPRTYDHHITYPNTFDPVKSADRRLGLDLQVLRKMLFTSYSHESHPPNRPIIAPVQRVRPQAKPVWPPFPALDTETVERAVEGPRNKPPTLGDQILDLVTRYYFETEDAALRAWISRARPPRSFGAQVANPVPQSSHQGQAWSTRKGQFEEFARIVEAHERKERKYLNDADIAHLARLQRQAAVQDDLLLYDGGAFSPPLVQTRDRGGHGPSGTKHGVDPLHWTITKHTKNLLTMPTWPEANPHVRFILQPVWCHRKELKEILKRPHLPLDLSLDMGRGRDRDGVWATGRSSRHRREKQDPDGVCRGRYARLRRRATSEPPPGSIVSADFPAPDPTVSRTVLQVLFPRMGLSKLDAKSRRRSLSRTRIEEMFDWDVSISSHSPLGVAASKLESHEEREPKSEEPAASGSPRSPTREARPGQAARHQARMKKKPRPGKAKSPPPPPPPPPPQCQNCLDHRHATSACKSPCGHCGAPNPTVYAKVATFTCKTITSRDGIQAVQITEIKEPPAPFEHQSPHTAPTCPVARRNRCKCVGFPVWHTAARCQVACKRECGNPAPRGSFKHRNAMTCRERCCMCGIRGHSGKECRLGKCRCGGAHLGQDCSWSPTCRVKGCDRYWCGLHCRECGSGEKPFVGWRCWRCLGSAEPFTPKPGRKKAGRRRHGGEESDIDVPEEGLGPAAGKHGQDRGGSSSKSAPAEAGPASLFGDPRERRMSVR